MNRYDPAEDALGARDVAMEGRLQCFSSSEMAVGTLRPAEPVYCLYPRRLAAAARQFANGFPGRVLYAVKANSHPEILRYLYDAEVRHFDTASLAEIALVKGLFPGAYCYFMAPSKLTGAAETAFRQFGVRHFVADHPSELCRLLEIADRNTAIHVRMKAIGPEAVYELSSKFGANEEQAAAMVAQVAERGCRAGLAFNVGSLCRHPEAYRRAIAAVGRVIETSKVKIDFLDVGGGFPAAYPGLELPPMTAFFDTIRQAAADIGLPADCELMCEPGRALVAAGQSLIVQVILIKDDLVFLNDGIYGGLKELHISDQSVNYPCRVFRLRGEASSVRRPYLISGPTCDTLDILPYTVDLPVDLQEGDWIEFGMAGAYTNAMSTGFNGFVPKHWVVVDGLDAEPPGSWRMRSLMSVGDRGATEGLTV